MSHIPAAWRSGYSLPKVSSRGSSTSSQSKGNVSGYKCNHVSLRRGMRHCVPLPCFRYSCACLLQIRKLTTCSTDALLYSRCHQKYVAGCHRANVKFIVVFPHALQTLVMLKAFPKVSSRGRSVSFSFSGNLGSLSVGHSRRYVGGLTKWDLA